MNFYRLDLQYVGSRFSGWQSQINAPSIQDCVEKALTQILNAKCRLTAASRTDSGVHAFHQVARLGIDKEIDLRKLTLGLQSLLPKDIGILKIEKTDAEFHPNFSSKAKLYRYLIWLSPLRNPFLDAYSWQVWSPLDIAKMQREAEYFKGTHDFSSFCASDSNATTRVRTVLDLDVSLQRERVQILVLGKGFLKQMVRNMVGTLVEVGAGKLPEGSVPKILAAKDRTMAAPTAPAQGLCLVRIFYEPVDTIKTISPLVEAQLN